MNKIIETDLLIIGAGAAALSCASSAVKSGVKNIIILEKSEKLGGVLLQCIHSGFGTLTFKEELTGTEYAQKLVNLIDFNFVKILVNTTALKLCYPERKICAVNPTLGFFYVNFKAIVISTGCYEEPIGALNIPGTRPAGIMTAGTSQNFVNIHGFLPGKKVAIFGTNIVGLTMARRLIFEGAKVECIIENFPYCRGPLKDEYLCTKDFNIPFYYSHTIFKIFGKNRIEKIAVSELDKNLEIVKDTEKIFEVDSLLVASNLIPENFLLFSVKNIKIDYKTKGPIVDQNMQTSVPGIFACGNNVYIHDFVDIVTKEANRLGRFIGKFIKNQNCLVNPKHITFKISEHFCYVVPQVINICNLDDTVEIYIKSKDVYNNVDILLSMQGKILKKQHKKTLMPSMLEKVVLNKDVFLNKSSDEILISLRKSS